MERVIAAGSKTDPPSWWRTFLRNLAKLRRCSNGYRGLSSNGRRPFISRLSARNFVPYRSDPRFHSFLASIGLSHLARAKVWEDVLVELEEVVGIVFLLELRQPPVVDAIRSAHRCSIPHRRDNLRSHPMRRRPPSSDAKPRAQSMHFSATRIVPCGKQC